MPETDINTNTNVELEAELGNTAEGPADVLASDPAVTTGARFGSAVGISQKTVAIGAPLAGGGDGAVFVYTLP